MHARLRMAKRAFLAAAVLFAHAVPATAAPRIALVVPGPNAYFDSWRQAVADAAKQYGFEGIFAVPPTDAFNLTQENALLDSLAARGYAGFALFPGDSHGTDAEEGKLLRRRIPTININGCTYDPSPAAFCISTDIYKAAAYQATELIRAIGGHGDIALLASQLTDPNTQLRVKAVRDTVAATGGSVTLVQIVADIDTPQLSPPAVNALLAARGNTLAGAMSTSYNPSIAMAVALTDNPQFRRVKFIGADAAPQVMAAVKAGIITGTLFQNTYGMVYAGAYGAFRLSQGCTVRADAPFDKSLQTAHQLTAGVLLVTEANVAQYPGPASLPDDTKHLLGEIDGKVLHCP